MDRSAAANFVMRAQNQEHRTKLENSIVNLEKKLGVFERWTTSLKAFQVNCGLDYGYEDMDRSKGRHGQIRLPFLLKI
jgi:hypothetical protein